MIDPTTMFVRFRTTLRRLQVSLIATRRFAGKAADVVGPHMAPPENAIVICVGPNLFLKHALTTRYDIFV